MTNMKNPMLKRIENSTFTIRFVRVAKHNGFKTVGKFKKYLLEHETIKVPGSLWPMKTSRLLKEIEDSEKSI